MNAYDQLSEHLNRSEIACKCSYCGGVAIFMQITIDVYEMQRKFLSEIIGREAYTRITSGVRCPRHNSETEGASKNSTHMYGLGMDLKGWYDDISVQDMNKAALKTRDWLFKKHKLYLAIGLYNGRIHLGIHGDKYRNWDMRK